jgi:hypothetical protein
LQASLIIDFPNKGAYRACLIVIGKKTILVAAHQFRLMLYSRNLGKFPYWNLHRAILMIDYENQVG